MTLTCSFQSVHSALLLQFHCQRPLRLHIGPTLVYLCTLELLDADLLVVFPSEGVLTITYTIHSPPLRPVGLERVPQLDHKVTLDVSSDCHMSLLLS